MEKCCMKSKGLLIGLAIALLGLLFYFSYFKEYLVISEIREKRNIDLCNDYYYNYPDGRYLDEVRFIDIEITRDISKVIKFIEVFPFSEYKPKVEEIRKDLWQKEIDKYVDKIKNSNDYSTESVKYFTELLNYMKDSGKNIIKLNIEGKHNLKDWSEYDTFKFLIKELDTNKLIPLKSNYQSNDISDIESVIRNSIILSFGNVLQSGFINIVSNYSKSDGEEPTINVLYTIKNQELVVQGYTFPNVWEYITFEDKLSRNDRTVEGYLIGIDIDFILEIEVPGSAVPYRSYHEGKPGIYVNNIDNVYDGYKKMTQQAFKDFGNTIAKKFVLN